MATALNFTWDTHEFDATLKRYLEETKKEASDVVAQKAFSILVEAVKVTKHADPTKIKQQLSQFVTVKETKSRKTGKIRLRQIARIETPEDTLAGRIVLKEARQRGEKLSVSEVIKRALAKIAARVRSVNFIRSGFLAPLAKIAAAAHRAMRTAGVKAVGREKGRATLSLGGWKPSIEFVNTAMQSKGAHDEMARIAEAGLKQAFASETADMSKYLEDRLQKVANRHNAR